jgi:hemoglobin
MGPRCAASRNDREGWRFRGHRFRATLTQQPLTRVIDLLPGPIRVVLLLAVAVCGACGGAPPRTSTVSHPSERPLYDRIGGMDAIKAMVDDLVEHAPVRDPLERLLCEHTGGPCKYTGRSLQDAHAGLAITEAQLAAFMDSVARTLAKHGLPRKEQEELLAVIAKWRAQVLAP